MSSQPELSSLMPEVGFDLPATPIESSTGTLIPADTNNDNEDRTLYNTGTYRTTLSMLEILIIASAISVAIVMVCLLLTAVKAR
jgi:hypothetical protein